MIMNTFHNQCDTLIFYSNQVLAALTFLDVRLSVKEMLKKSILKVNNKKINLDQNFKRFRFQVKW